MKKSRNTIKELLLMLSELSEAVWQIGAILAFAFFLLTVPAMQYAVEAVATHESSLILSHFKVFAWIPYMWPIICLSLSGCFGFKAFQGYRKRHSF